MVGLGIHGLPTEILEEVILNALELGGGVDLNTSQGIWTCSHISRRWRAVALARCSFWSRITIEGVWLPSSAVEILETILMRSNNHPITLNLTYDGPGLPLILDKLISHSYRLQSAALQMAAYRLSQKCIFPALQTLEIVCPPLPHQSSYEQSIIYEAPALRSLTVRGFTTSPGIQALALPWCQITVYHAYRCNENDQLRLLPLLPNMVEYHCLTESTCRSIDEYSPINGHVLCSRLENLVVDGTKLMDALIAPSLQRVQIPLALAQMQALYRLVQRSSCRIRALTLVGDREYVFPESIISLLHSLPYLTTLQINHRNSRPPPFFEHLVHDGDCAPILPRLQHLLISRKYASESYREEVESLVRVLYSRNGSLQGVEALRSLCYELHQSYAIHPRRRFFLMQEVYGPLFRHKGVVDIRLSLL